MSSPSSSASAPSCVRASLSPSFLGRDGDAGARLPQQDIHHINRTDRYFKWGSSVPCGTPARACGQHLNSWLTKLRTLRHYAGQRQRRRKKSGLSRPDRHSCKSAAPWQPATLDSGATIWAPTKVRQTPRPRPSTCIAHREYSVAIDEAGRSNVGGGQ